MNFLRSALAAAALLSAAPAVAADGVRLPEGFIDVAPLVVPVLDDYRMSGRLRVHFTVQSDDSAVKERFSAAKPKMVDIYVRRLTEFARLWVDPSRPVDMPRLAKALNEATEEFTPKSGAKVYILEAVVERQR